MASEIIFPEKMEPLDENNIKASLKVMDDYIRYMTERIDFAFTNYTTKPNFKNSAEGIVVGTVDADYVKTLDLEVGNEIKMGPDAKISWSNVTDTDDVATDEEVVEITKDTVTAPFIKSLNLEVGNEIKMGANAKISWDNVTDRDDIPNTSKVTEITKDTIKTATIEADQITAGTLDASKLTVNGLVVGDNVTMGNNAKISWTKVTNQPTILSSTDVTTISNNCISTAEIKANQITTGTLSDAGGNYSLDMSSGAVNMKSANITGGTIKIKSDSTTNDVIELLYTLNDKDMDVTISPSYITVKNEYIGYTVRIGYYGVDIIDNATGTQVAEFENNKIGFRDAGASHYRVLLNQYGLTFKDASGNTTKNYSAT